MSFNYKALKLKIKEVYDTQGNYANELGISQNALNNKLNNHSQWTSKEIAKSCELLNIPLEESHTYFFSRTV